MVATKNQENMAGLFLLSIVVALLTLGSAGTVNRRHYGTKNSKNRYDTFDMELIQKMAQGAAGNVLVSPLNQKILLAMIMEGAVGETAKEIRTVLQLPLDPNQATRRVTHWITSLNPAQTKTAGSDTLTAANRIFLNEAYTPNENYRQRLQKFYQADVQTIRKEYPDKAAELINNWVKHETSGLIPSIISERDIKNDFVVALASSIFFRGTWLYQFKKNETKTECFYKYGQDQCTKLEMMEMWEVDLPYAFIRELDATVVELPYQDRKHSMVIVLPNERNGITNLISKINQFPMYSIVSRLYTNSVGLKIPKFTVDYENDMVDTFRSLYITKAFDLRAQLDNMVAGKAGLRVSKIFHKSKIIVNEEGSEAAAVSLGGIVPLSLHGNSEPIPFIADHSFLYFIKDDSNNILFAGKYSGP